MFTRHLHTSSTGYEIYIVAVLTVYKFSDSLKSVHMKCYYGCVLQSTIGKMKFCSRRMKGFADQSFMPIKVAFHKESTHAEVLEKCIHMVSVA